MEPTKTNTDPTTTKTKKSTQNDDAELVAKCNRLYGAAQDSRKLLDWKWFIYDLWVSGNHYAKYDRDTQQIVGTAREDGRPKVVINKTYTALRAVRNYVLRNKPRAEATPVNLTPDNIGQVIKINHYLDYLHDKLHLRRKLKGSVWHALKYSVGYWQVLWNDSAEDGAGEIEINEVDPYDLYWDPSAKYPEEARFVCLAVRRNVEDLKDDPKYEQYKDKLDNLPGDRQAAASSMKARLIQFEAGSSTASTKEQASVIVKEFWYKEVQADKTTKIRIVTLAGDQIIRNELTDLNRIPFFRLPADIEPMSMYGQGWAKNIIPVNRLLDRLESQLAEFNDLMNKGKWVSDKGAGVRVINNENGQIIEKKRGFEVRQEPISPPAAVLIQQIQNANMYIEDMASIHDATAGRIPIGAKSGSAIEALQQGDSNNLSELTENLEEFLEDVYEYVLYLVSQKYQFTRNIIPTNQAGEKEFIQVIGEKAQAQPPGAVVIGAKNMVDVKITSWLAQTPEAKRDAIEKLAQIMLANQTPLDEQTILEGFEVGNIADVIQRMKDRQAEQQAQEQAQKAQDAQMQAQTDAQANAKPQSGAREAIAAIRSILMGQKPVTPPAVDPGFLDYIDQFLRGPEAAQLPPDAISAIQGFRDQVAQKAPGGAGSGTGMPAMQGMGAAPAPGPVPTGGPAQT